jgi:Uma2 family endonuclease
VTPEQYLEIERKAEYKSEYLDGKMIAMPRANRDHNRLTRDLALILCPQVEKHGCELFTSDMRIQVSPTGLYAYPDLTVVCGPQQFVDDCEDTLLNPTFLVEVLSPSTEGYDRGLKSERYRKMESLREYLLIEPDRLQINIYTRREDGVWLLGDGNRSEQILELRSIGSRVSMAELYRHIDISVHPRLRNDYV